MFTLMSSALVLVMAGAILWDVRTHRIPNTLTLVGVAVAVLLRTFMGGDELLAGLLGGGAGLLLGFALFALGGFGGGDAKLLMTAGAFLGPQGLFHGALAAGVVGGMIALAEVIRRRVWWPVLLNTKDLLVHVLTLGRAGEGRTLRSPGAVKVPYGVAIGVGAVVAWFFPELFQPR